MEHVKRYLILVVISVVVALAVAHSAHAEDAPAKVLKVRKPKPVQVEKYGEDEGPPDGAVERQRWFERTHKIVRARQDGC